MPTTDTSERGLEGLIVADLTGRQRRAGTGEAVRDDGAAYAARPIYVQGDPRDYDREHCVDLTKLLEFIEVTQPRTFESLGLGEDGSPRFQFLNRLQSEVSRRGVVDVLRSGIKHGPASVDLFYGAPSPDNPRAVELFNANIFSVTRQLKYSRDETQLALDLALFINGLPVATFELKNSLTKQTYDDAIQQYKRDRDEREPLFQFPRCMVHFAVDDSQVWMCTRLRDARSWFLPFNKGWNDGAGNPPNPGGLMTDYLWKDVLRPDSLTNIIENYAQIVEEPGEKGRKKRVQIFPRYQQLDVVRKLLADVSEHGVGKRYLIQHSAGSGKSNSIAWLAHQLVDLQRDGQNLVDSIVVVTDRIVLDRQLRDTVKQFVQVRATVEHAERSADLRTLLQQGKKIIITTIQKFPWVLDEIGSEHAGRRFAIIIDEAHSSQGGRAAAAMQGALRGRAEGEAQEDYEDIVNRIMESRKLLPNASYFAFTATPKNKTLEIFGEPYQEGGKFRHRPFHSYTMKQAIQEGFILDVLQNYTPVHSYYRLVKSVPEDPEFDVSKAQRKLRRYVEGHEHAVRVKAEIVVDHFHDSVMAANKIGGKARAMVVTDAIARAVEYYVAIDAYLKERKSPYRAIVAFSGEYGYGGRQMTEAHFNDFPSNKITEKIKEDPYRFLVVADKFQTGYDEPLLHTMYVDKHLAGIKAVQTLSRLNRAHPEKHDTFVLDFMNSVEVIEAAFSDYYRTTILSEETDPNKLHDLKSALDGYQVYSAEDVDQLVRLYLGGADRDALDPILDAAAATYISDLDEDSQVDFKGKAKAFIRTYSFLSSILPYANADWEKLSIFLNFLVPKLPAPKEEDLSKGILEAIDMDSYRAEVQAAFKIALEDKDAEIGPVPVAGGGAAPEPELDRLSNIIRSFNEQFGNITWKDADRIQRVLTEEVPEKVAADKAYQNAMKHSDRQNARIEHDKALQRVITDLLADHADLFKNFMDNESFKKWLSDAMFWLTYEPQPA